MIEALAKLPYGTSVPADWKVVPLKYLVDLTNGYSFKSEDWKEAGTPILRIENLNGSDNFNFADLKLDNRYRVTTGDLLYSWSGNPGTSFGPFRWNQEGAFYLNQHIYKVHVHGCDREFLFWALKAATHWIERELTSGMIGMVHVTKEELGNVPIPIPPIEEQRRIADFLDAEAARIDRLISYSQRQRELSGHVFKEMIRSRTTTSDGSSRDTGIAWMPKVGEGWSLLKVAHQFMTGSGTTPTSSEPRYFGGPHPWVNSADVNDGRIHSVRLTVTDQALEEFSALKLHLPGSLVIAMYGQGATKGKVGLLQDIACVNQACCVLSPIGKISSDFAFFWFRAHKEAIVAMAYGAGQPNLSQELIRQLKIPVPELSMQARIVEELTSREAELRRRSELLSHREALLSERRQALIMAAVTGSCDVSSASGRGAAA